MDYKEAVRRLAPCGLDCSRCADYSVGEIKELSVRLAELLKGYLRVARVKESKNPVFTGYPQFEEVLATFSQAACSGCRGGQYTLPLRVRRLQMHPGKRGRLLLPVWGISLL